MYMYINTVLYICNYVYTVHVHVQWWQYLPVEESLKTGLTARVHHV